GEADPAFLSAEDPVVAVARGRRFHAPGVGAARGFGEGEASDELALGHAGQPMLLLLLAAKPVNGGHRERALHGDEGAPRGVACFEFVADEAVADGSGAGAAVSVEVHAEYPE